MTQVSEQERKKELIDKIFNILDNLIEKGVVEYTHPTRTIGPWVRKAVVCMLKGVAPEEWDNNTVSRGFDDFYLAIRSELGKGFSEEEIAEMLVERWEEKRKQREAGL